MNIKRFESLESNDPEDFFQKLEDTWGVEIETDYEVGSSSTYDDDEMLLVSISIDSLEEFFFFFSIEHRTPGIKSSTFCLGKYCDFMKHLPNCISHMISSCEGKYEYGELNQNEYRITISFIIQHD